MRKSAKNQLLTFKTFSTMNEVQNNAEQMETRKSKVDEIFTLVKKGNEVKIAIGNYQISRRIFKSYQAAEDYLRQRPYEILINATCLFTNLQLKENENAKTTEAGK